MPSAEENAIVQQQIEELHALHLNLGDERVASYYPPEMESEAHRFGIASTHIDGHRTGTMETVSTRSRYTRSRRSSPTPSLWRTTEEKRL
jgi:hypothetical protein